MSYAELSGIERALAGLSLRIAVRMPRRVVRLQDALPALRAAHADLVADFNEFFPQVQALAADWLQETPAAREDDSRATAAKLDGAT